MRIVADADGREHAECLGYRLTSLVEPSRHRLADDREHDIVDGPAKRHLDIL